GRCAPSRSGRGSRAAAGPSYRCPPGRGASAPDPCACRACCCSSGLPQPLAQLLLAALDVLERHVLLLLVREQRVARPEVDRRDAEAGEAGDVGPAELRVRGAADRLEEGRRGG